MYAVIWTTWDMVDHWLPFPTLPEAKAHYASIVSLDSTWTASICAVVESTDYDPAAS